MTGREGELLFMRTMRNEGFTVEDVSHNSAYYYKGDALITNPATGNTRIFEVKTDNVINRSGNLYLETFNINSERQNFKGWFEFCKCDYLAYIDAVAKKIYCFVLADLKERVAQINPPKGKCGFDSEGYKLPLNKCKDLVIWEVQL